MFGAAGIPAPVFQALVPRRAGVFDGNANTFGTADEPATFARASDGIYLDADGKYKVAAAGAIRAEYSSANEFLGCLFEPAITNKCNHYNASPDAGFTNLFLGGDPAASMSRVDASSSLASAGLGELGSGLVLQLDNSAGVADANINVTASPGNTNTHTASVWGRRISGSNSWEVGNAAGSSVSTSDAETWTRLARTYSPSSPTQQMSMRCQAGVVAQFLLAQYEELAVASSPIVTAGASASRAVDSLDWAAAPAGLVDAQGMAMIDFAARYTAAEASAGNWGLMSSASFSSSLLYLREVSGTMQFRSSDGTTVNGMAMTGALAARDTPYRVMVGWSGSARWMAWKPIGGSWTTQTGIAYDGGWTRTELNFGMSHGLPICLHRGLIFNRDIGVTEATRLF